MSRVSVHSGGVRRTCRDSEPTMSVSSLKRWIQLYQAFRLRGRPIGTSQAIGDVFNSLLWRDFSIVIGCFSSCSCMMEGLCRAETSGRLSIA